MFTFNVERWVPRFLLNDRNGYALAKAIEAALQRMNDTVAQGLACISDYDTMPEWRLDELAWETNCLYDYNADRETKIKWIRNASRFFLSYGTPLGIIQYLSGVFDSVRVEEAGRHYVGDPYHFRVLVAGEWSDEANEWAIKAINATKNVRSVLDGVYYIGQEGTSEAIALAKAVGIETRGMQGIALGGGVEEVEIIVYDEEIGFTTATGTVAHGQIPQP